MRAGLRDELISEALRAELVALGDRVEEDRLDPAEAPARLALYLGRVAERVLAGVPEAERAARQLEVVNTLLAELDPEEQIVSPAQVLLGIREQAAGLTGAATLPPRPEIPLSASDLLFNGAGQPTIGTELRSELQSADRVDVICAFVIWSGVRMLRDQLRGVIERGGRVRVITTTYMGATEPKALNALVELGAEVRVAFDARTTKLHAKSWMLDRPGGLSTAFIGSSNLSHTALHDGLEWNVRLSQVDAPHLIERMRATFDSHWEDEHFEPYDSGREADLARALGADRRRRSGAADAPSFFGLDVHPYPFQRGILEQLSIERERHGRHRNLVVAATGTGKTVVAALDYRQLVTAAERDLSLLFVAHREQILNQSMGAFRAVMRDGSFGEVLGGGAAPVEGRHVFAMVQSLDAERVDSLDPEQFDVVIVDEFHHAAAPSYTRLLERLEPTELLGLTATPERMDGADVTEWFGGRIAYELRLWEAIDQGFLAPFQYFGVADDVDLSQLEWRRGGYVTGGLDNLLTGNDMRVAKLIAAIERIVDFPERMKALGFCVSVEHARYMAERFTRAGLRAEALSGESSVEERRQALGALERGEARAIFSVDVLGEGVDVPLVDTLLLLRPTQSATVLTQQLGRGLRRAEGKRCLTVIDLIGQQHREFRFDKRLRALVDARRGPARAQAEAGFPFLPAGCEISLDRASETIVLENLRAAARLGRWPTLVQELKDGQDRDLAAFLAEGGREPEEIYRPAKGSWTALRRAAGRDTRSGGNGEEDRLLKAVGRLLHVDDEERTSFFRRIVAEEQPPVLANFDARKQRLLAMLHFSLWGVSSRMDSFDAGFARLLALSGRSRRTMGVVRGA